MSNAYCGWLLGLSGTTDEVRIPPLIIRRMTKTEQDRICERSIDFFASDPKIWRSTTTRYPYVYEKRASSAMHPIGGEDFVGVLISLLSSGEVRTPIQWMELPTGLGGMSSSSDVISLFYRLINGQLQGVVLEQIVSALEIAVGKLQEKIFIPSHEIFGSVLLDRFIATKAHPIPSGFPVTNRAQLIARAADTAMMLEYLFHEGSTTEVGFRLGMSIAWLLGTTPTEREEIIGSLKATYDLRSKRVHGADVSKKPVKEQTLQSIVRSDWLLRRSILAKLLSGVEDAAWQEIFTSARLGGQTDDFDNVHWLPK